uniref:Uncharacterized protein n=1 Tax=Anguilla anguilla TaxID=7936 RepID=A0A0E9QR18_ANGAN
MTFNVVLMLSHVSLQLISCSSSLQSYFSWIIHTLGVYCRNINWKE